MIVHRIDQGMAADAARVLRGEDGEVTVTPELRRRYRQLRVMLHTAGLAATYAFIASKAGDASAVGGAEKELARAYRKVADAIRERLSSQGLLSVDA
jgi:CRISPR/Cas system CMR-associated protein Cmr5 small subunit